ncbi:MAG: GNAT family N-acetyltransferase [Clostridia bacterium]|nr:GNAT family N-acetyltransferase [Clostridia bacterium]
MHCIFRRLTSRDLPLVLHMNDDFRPGFITPDGAARFLADKHNWLFAALQGDEISAFAYGYALDRLDGRRMLYIHEVGVHRGCQRQGIGTSLMESLKAAAQSEGFCRLFLIAHQSNTAANALYKKCGGIISPDSGGNDTTWFFHL